MKQLTFTVTLPLTAKVPATVTPLYTLPRSRFRLPLPRRVRFPAVVIIVAEAMVLLGVPVYSSSLLPVTVRVASLALI